MMAVKRWLWHFLLFSSLSFMLILSFQNCGGLGTALSFNGISSDNAGPSTPEPENPAQLTIIEEPLDQKAFPGQNVEFQVHARPESGGTLTYQWQKDGEDIPGATDSTLTLTNVSRLRGDEGNYSVIVTTDADLGGEITRNTSQKSKEAELDIADTPTGNILPRFIQRSLSRYIPSGESTAIGVSFYGNPQPSVQWFEYDEASSEFKAIPEATSSHLVIEGAKSRKTGVYRAEITNDPENPESTLRSTPILVSVDAKEVPPYILSKSDNLSQDLENGENLRVGVGQEVRFSIEAVALPEPTFQWFRNDEPLVDKTKNTLTISTEMGDGQSNYSVKISNELDTKKETSVLNVVDTMTVVRTPADLSVGLEDPARIDVEVSSSVESFQWFKDGAPITNLITPQSTLLDFIVDTITGLINVEPSPVSNNVTIGITIDPTTADNSGTYSVRLGNINEADGFVELSAELTVVSPPQIINQVDDRLGVTPGSTVNFSVLASGSSLTYQWYKDGTRLIGATNRTLNILVIGNISRGTYRVDVTNLGGTVSSSAILTVNSGNNDDD